MDRFRKTRNKNIWWTIFWVVVLAIAFIASVCSKSKATSTEINDQQQPSVVYTCYAESVSSVGVGVSPDRPTASQAALRSCQRQSPSWQACRLTGCVPR